MKSWRSLAGSLLPCLALMAALWTGAAAPALASGPGEAPGPSASPSVEDLAWQEFEDSMNNDSWSSPSGLTAPSDPESLVGFGCLPTCDVTDGRFLAIANGAALATLSEASLEIRISAEAAATSFQIGIFDGDANVANDNWDVGVAPFLYTLFADPDRDGSGTTIVAGPFVSATLPNNGWFDFNVTTSPAAAAPSGNFYYRLVIENTDLLATAINSFKIRTSGTASIEVPEQPFGFYAALQSVADANIIYPAFPALTPTNYDGTFSFLLDVKSVEPDFVVWDGDLDRGAFDGTDQDTDDPDTPGAPFLPPWATGDALFEGVAIGAPGTTGAPPDDRDPAGNGIFLQKTPSVIYEIVDSNGATYNNLNPSGNREWEQFRISTDPADPQLFDALAPELPAGIYRARAIGLDMQNLNFWRFFHPVLCRDENRDPCVPLRPFLVGDTVYFDTDGDGVQDAGEPGIEGVLVELLDDDGDVLATTTTDANGNYDFEVDAGTFTVRIESSNFDPGGPLEGYASTTGGEDQTDTVVDDNVLTFDFGYQGTGSIGNFVWFDLDFDGVQDAGEPGIGGVTIDLTEAGPDGILGTGDDVTFPSQTTDSTGTYDFLNLPPGTYQVDVDDSTLPAGVFPTTLDPLVVSLGPGEDFDDADFGYAGTGAIGDRVWNDLDGDGIQDVGEPGLNGVTVTLQGDLDGDGVEDITLTTVTSTFGVTQGFYFFSNLPPAIDTGDGCNSGGGGGDDGDGDGLAGNRSPGPSNLVIPCGYTVTVDPATLPAGIDTPTFDFDGIGTPNTAFVQLSDGEVNDLVDFGYQGANGAIGDRVWEDLDGDGVQDAGEPGINGVTVELRDSGGTVIATAVTAGDGNYDFDTLAPDTYTVTVVAATLPPGLAPTFDFDGTGTPNTASVPLGSGETNNNVDFGYRGTGAIGDTVWRDDNGNGVQDGAEPGIPGVTVTLKDSGGNVVGTDVTDANGNYGFTDLGADTYTVEVDPATLPDGLAPTADFDGIATPNEATVPLAGGETNDNVDFGYQGTGVIGDRVWEDLNGDGVQDAGEPGINGVTVTLRDSGGNVVDTAVTSGDGNYSFTNLPADTYTVEVDPSTLPAGLAPTFDADGTGTPNEATVTLAGGETNNDVDFGYRGTGVIGDRVWEDLNGDGVQDAGEPGINGVTVTLRDSGGNVVDTAVTSGDGNYSFTDLGADTYTVEVDPLTLPAGVVPTSDFDGIATPNVATVPLAGGETNNDVDFGYQQPVLFGSIGDRVWNDLNGDGVQDAGEPGINGVTVTLSDSGGNVIATQVTAGDGNYLFTGLEEGVYTVTVDPSTLPANVAQTFDADGLATPNEATVALAAGEDRLDVDFGYGPCGECDGKVTELTLQYLGDSTANVQVIAKRGPSTDVVFSGVLNPGDTFEIVGPATGNPGFIGTLGTEIRISVDGAEHTTIHTSCSQPIGPGLVSGDFKVLAGASRHGGLLCPVDDPGDPGDDCGCEGKVARLRLRFLGSETSNVEVVGRGGPNSETLFSGPVAPGGTLEVNSFTTANPGFEGTVGTEIDIFVDGVLQTTIHTSCSQPIGPGLVSGDFQVVDGFSRDFPGPLCPVDGETSEQCPDEAQADEFGTNGGHAFWLPGISEDLVFQGDTARFTQFADGTATLTGTVADENDPNQVFDVSVTFSGQTFVTPPGSPKKELDSGAYVENGGPVDTDTWYYYTAYLGVLTGGGDWAGAQVTFTRTGSAFQVGNGASGKNVGFGASGWFDWAVVSQPSAGGSFPQTGLGDINIDLGNCPDEECVDIDFETDGNGNPLHKGQIIDNEFAALGIHVTTNDPANHPAMIFDASNPTGGDNDLGTPNQDFGGPGVGAGGRAGTAGENSVDRGKVLIISEDRDQSDPDDNAGGGEIIFTFDNPVFIGSVGILDIDEGWGGSIKAFDASNNLISEVPMQDLGNNSFQTVTINQDGVSKLKVWFPGSGAVTDLEVCTPGGGGPGGGGDCTPGDVRDDFDNISYSNNDGSVDWSGDWIEDDVAGAGPNAGNVYMQPGLLFLEDAPDTGTQPSIARQVDMSGAAAATLRFAFDTDSGVDPTDAVTVEISDNGGATWTVLEVITGITGTVNESRTFDISPYISAQTQVRFRVSNLYGGSDEFFCLQWVEISWTCPQDPNAPGSIGGTVWNDGNGNGTQEDPSTGLPGVAVRLKQNGSVIDTTTTDGSGEYAFFNLSSGGYTVQVDTSTLPAGMTVPTYDLDGIATADEATLTLGGGQDRDDADFGYQEASSPCSYCEHYTGSLDGAGAYAVQPDGNYYWADSGSHEAWLTGAGDFDLYLFKWDGSNWVVVSSSTADGTSSEHLQHNGGSGYYVWLVQSYSGSGSYDLYLDRP